MSYGRVVMKIPILFLLSSVFLGTDGELIYVPRVTDNIVSCENFANEFLDCDELLLGSMQGEEGDDAAKLSGKIKTLGEIISDYDVELNIWKVMDLGEEFMYGCRINFCSSLHKEDSPWSPIIEKLNITSCPVPINDFVVHGMTVSLEAVKDVMCHDFIGVYRIQFEIIDVADKLSCHQIEIRIEEINTDDTD